MSVRQKTSDSKQAYSALYGDLHFHTHYSDNRDRASVEEMIERGLERGIRIFGTGDHNHNITAESFREEMAETDEARSRHSELAVFNNCEMTFLIGHFHVFDPGPITGSIAEAYAYLYEHHDRLTMANHPGLPSDEWDMRVIPTISAIEVVNGAVLNAARREGARFRSILEVPAVGTYVRYLRLGIPVAVLGNSDAHALEELGTGLTGFHLEGTPDKEKVLDAIRRRTTFATTTTAIDLSWRRDAESLLWTVEIKSASGFNPADFAVEVYAVDQLVTRAEMSRTTESGSIRLETPGLYWIAVVSGENFAVSSPIEFELERFEVAEEDLRHSDEARSLAEREGRSVEVTPVEVIAEREVVLTDPIRVAVYSNEGSPEVNDSEGRVLDVQYSGTRGVLPIIEKECEPWRFSEFYVWLERNEVHEYRFSAITYRLEGSTFFFSAELLPYRVDKRAHADALFRDQVQTIRALVERSERCRISVVVPPIVEIGFMPGRIRLPLSISAGIEGATSRIALLSDREDTVRLEQFFLESER